MPCFGLGSNSAATLLLRANAATSHLGDHPDVAVSHGVGHTKQRVALVLQADSQGKQLSGAAAEGWVQARQAMSLRNPRLLAA